MLHGFQIRKDRFRLTLLVDSCNILYSAAVVVVVVFDDYVDIGDRLLIDFYCLEESRE